MNSRQRKKIIDTYFMETETEMLIPPSVVRYEDRLEQKYDSKAWRISHPEEAKQRDEAIQKIIDEMTKQAEEN